MASAHRGLIAAVAPAAMPLALEAVAPPCDDRPMQRATDFSPSDVSTRALPRSIGLAAISLALTCGLARSNEAPRSYASPAQCERGHDLPREACRTAFANARGEFEAKSPRFGSRRQCFRRFGPCMPWPIGTQRLDQFRPQWLGITVSRTASETVAKPWVAPGKLTLDFAPQSVSALAPGSRPADTTADEIVPIQPASHHHEAESDDPGPAPAPPPPGSGFKIIDGVLTYPAPARFQPGALRHP